MGYVIFRQDDGILWVNSPDIKKILNSKGLFLNRRSAYRCARKAILIRKYISAPSGEDNFQAVFYSKDVEPCPQCGGIKTIGFDLCWKCEQERERKKKKQSIPFKKYKIK